jgi:uncharacterized membrane protein
MEMKPMPSHKPLSLEQLRKIRKPVRNINIEHREKLSKLDNLALWVTVRVGTMGFFLIIMAWSFDPYPAFVLWLFISNMIQILLMPLIMVGQNLQGRHSEARATADFEIDTQSEREVEAILQHLENQNELILSILHHLEQDKKQPGD